jgi:hypothetical protein
MKKLKKIKLLATLTILLLSTSCSYNAYEAFTVKNRNHLALLEPGMSKIEVMQIMGDNSIKSSGAYVGNPYKTETLQAQGGQNISVFWYYTEIRSSNGRVDPDELTPVVFKDGKMEGYGWSFYRDKYQHIEIINR